MNDGYSWGPAGTAGYDCQDLVREAYRTAEAAQPQEGGSSE